MMTVRRIDGDGNENVVSVITVGYNASTGLLHGIDAHGQPYEYGHDGQAFVMNENGKTVAIYNFKRRQEEARSSK